MITRDSVSWLARWSITIPEPVRFLLIATLVMSLGAFVPLEPLRALLVLPAALLVPGLAAVLLAFGSRPQLDTLILLGLSVLLSISFYPLLALTLYILLIPYSVWTVLIGTDLTIAVLLAVIARRARSEAASYRPLRMRKRITRAARLSLRDTRLLLRIAATVVIASLAFLLERCVEPVAVDAPFTQFYLTGQWAHLDSIAYAGPHGRLVVNVGITNHTHHIRTYQILPVLDSAPWHEHLVTLADGKQWSGTVSGSVPITGCLHRLAITLRAAEDHAFQSELSLWTRSASGAPSTCATVRQTPAAP